MKYHIKTLTLTKAGT